MTSFRLKIMKEHVQVKNEVDEQSVFRTPSNIYEGGFCDYSEGFPDVCLGFEYASDED